MLYIISHFEVIIIIYIFIDYTVGNRYSKLSLTIIIIKHPKLTIYIFLYQTINAQ